ncbi:MAG TPA: hypothetical protein VJ901_14625 [Thermoanaerobaculia bacterium]|nr:hypothetical protein [Thermoanaerobaculia bacterium]
MPPFIKAAVAAFLASLALTPAVAALAHRIGAVAKPKSDRWHSKPTAMLGGVAIVLAVAGALLAFVPMSRDDLIVLSASVALFLVGLADDFFHIKPYQKLIGQLLAAAAVVAFGLVLPWTPYYTVNVLITLFWLVGITNAVNMLDNMDGLAAGVSAIAAIFLAMNFAGNLQMTEALMLAAFGAALAGFLVYNHNPASIFMGDCGSMFIGFFLASIALVSGTGGGRSRSIVAVLAVPVLVLVVPIFDTTFVTLMRKMAGRAASQGGRDHTSHRLVALGLTEKRAVWMLYTFAAAAGELAMFVRRAQLDISVSAIASFILVLTFAGIHLGRVRVYDEQETRPQALVAFLVDVSYKRRLFEVALDVVLIVLSYYFAGVLVFGPASDSARWDVFFRTLPVAIALKLAALLFSGVYRGLWRYVSLSDVARQIRGVIIGSAATLLYAAIVVAGHVVVSVFIIDAMLLLLAIAASRFSFRMLRGLLPSVGSANGQRVVIYGAGDGGALLLRELLQNPALQRVPVAFVDDDPRKKGRVLHGLPIGVPNGAGSIADLCRVYGANELLVSTRKVPPPRLRQIVEECESAGVAVGRMQLEINAIAADDMAPSSRA